MNKLKSAKTKLGNTIELIGELADANSSLVIGVFHGDEPQGKYLIEEYLKKTYPLIDCNVKSYATMLKQSSYPPLEGGSTSMMSGWGQHGFTEETKAIAKQLRNNATIHEQILWKYLKNGQFMGLKFRRQQPIGKYIADFMCCNPKIIIELDGGQHNENIEYDKKRDDFLSSKGYKVIRIWNNYIYSNIEGVLEYLKHEIDDPTRKSKISTLPQGEGMNFERGILFIPCLNPDGMQLGQRTNANGVDLNRNFPTKNWGEDTSAAGDNPSDYYGGKCAGSEIETQFVMEVIEEYKPSKILTLHAPYKVVNYDGPAKSWAQEVSKIIGYPVEASIGYPTPGSFGTYAGVERNIPTITLELDEEIPVEQLVQPVFDIYDML